MNPITRFTVKHPITQDWTVARVSKEAIPLGWEEVFRQAAPELELVSEILIGYEKGGNSWLPLKADLFNAFRLTSLSDIKVVIVGQDPYHQIIWDGKPRAMGLSFSVRKGDDIPVSLRNIYRELSQSVGFIPPNHGDLTEWAQQGVLLLNMSLSVKPNTPDSSEHRGIWWGFLHRVITAINRDRPNAIFVLWGAKAQEIKGMLSDSAVILESSHPSGFSAYKGFMGCGHFRQINEHLRKIGEREINWQLH